MIEIKGGVAAPKGFTASGAVAGIKKPGSPKRDCALILSEVPAALAGVFTTNRVKAAPVLWDQQAVARGTARAVFTNSGNANACTGSQGAHDVEKTAELVAAATGIAPEEVCVCSTGVIGVPLPMDRIAQGVTSCAQSLSRDGSPSAANAIMTTDTVPKEEALELELPGGTVRLGGIAKGAGMLAPNMATMLAFITTDASIAAPALQELLRAANSTSFNRICVDNDTSTNDTVLLLANGASGVELQPGSEDYQAFAEALSTLCQSLAKGLVRDGEGVTKFVEVRVEGASTDEDAQRVARAVAHSMLCKTAFFGQDANWGRLACAAGYAGVPFDPEHLSIWLENLQLMCAGERAEYEEMDAAAIMGQREFSVRLSIGQGHGEGVYWTSDLSHDYVTINADYRT